MIKKYIFIIFILFFQTYLFSQDFTICKDYFMIDEGEKNEKEKSLEKILQSNPENIECMLKLASVYLRTGKVALGFDLITKAYELNPKYVRNAKISKILDLALRLSEMKKQAIANNDYKIWNKLGDIYFDIGIFKEALNAYKSSLDINPNQEKIEILLAVCYGNTEQLKKAKTTLEDVLAKNPKSFYANYYYAKLLKNELSDPRWKVYMKKAKKILENDDIKIDEGEKDFLMRDIESEVGYE